MASASTADTWRGARLRGERRPAPRPPRPEPREHVSRIAPPPPPRPRPADRPRPTDLPPFPEHLARAGRGGAAGSGRPLSPRARPAVDRGREPDDSGPARTERPAEGRPAEGRPAKGVSADRRSAPAPAPENGRLRGAIAVAGVFLVAVVGAAVDSLLGSGPGLVTLVVLAGASGVAAATVRRRDLVSTVVAPPLVFLAVVALSLLLWSDLTLVGLGTLLVRGFPTMAVGTGVALVVAILRWAARR